MRVFNEKQKFNQWWLKAVMALVLVCGLIPLWFLRDEETQSESEWIIAIIIFGAVISTTIALLFFVLQLRTRIDERGVHYAYYPIHRKMKTIPWNQIEFCSVRKYNPIGEFGGWGYRITFGSQGKALNVRGDMGIQLEYDKGKRLLIGTQDPEAARKTIAAYLEKNNLR